MLLFAKYTRKIYDIFKENISSEDNRAYAFMHSISWVILLGFGLQHLSKIAIMISAAMFHGIPW